MKVTETDQKAHEKRLLQREKRIFRKCLDKEYNILIEKLNALKEESLWVLHCNIGNMNIGNEIEEHLKKMALFFHQRLSTIKSNDSSVPGSLRYRTHMAEHLRKRFVQTVNKIDEWVNILIDEKLTNCP